MEAVVRRVQLYGRISNLGCGVEEGVYRKESPYDVGF